MPYADPEKDRQYHSEWRKQKRRQRGLQKQGRKPQSEEEKQVSLAKRKLYELQWRKENPWSSRNIVARLLGNAKKRAKDNGWEFDITKEDIVVPEYCPYLGIKLTSSMPRGSSRRDVASLDRIDPTKGYIKGNIEVISHLANTMKSDATPELLLKFADAISRKLRLPGL